MRLVYDSNAHTYPSRLAAVTSASAISSGCANLGVACVSSHDDAYLRSYTDQWWTDAPKRAFARHVVETQEPAG